MKKLLCTIAALSAIYLTNAQTARVQVIHNSADAAANEVDVYLGSTLLFDDFAFRTATPFANVTAGSPITIGIAPGNSTSVNDTIYRLTTTLTANNTYIIVANGIVSPTGYSPATPFGLNVYAMGREAASNGSNTDLLVMHGSTDAPAVDVRSGIETLVDNISYGSFSTSYLELPTADYKVRITTTTGATTVQTYSAPLATLSLNGGAGVVVASGFLNPANNSNGPAFGLYVALPTGGSLLALPVTSAEAIARVQAIHNSGDAVADEVDVYINGDLAIDNFAYRTATEFLDLPAKTPLQIGIAPKTSTSVTDTIYNLTATLDSAAKYILVANGTVSPTGYTPAQPFRLSVFGNAREAAANSANTDVLVMHGSTDAPTVDVRNNNNVLVNDIAFGSFAANYLELPVNNYIIDVTDASGANKVASYTAPLQTLNLGGAAITVLASGFVTPGSNSNGPAFGLYAASPAGGALIALPVYVSVGSIAGTDKQFTIAPNPASTAISVNGDFSNANVTVYDITGKTMKQVNSFNGGNINIADLVQGVYVLRVEENGNTGFQRFIKQ